MYRVARSYTMVTSFLPAGHPQVWENSKFRQFHAVACLPNQKMVINSAEHADRLYPVGNITHFHG